MELEQVIAQTLPERVKPVDIEVRAIGPLLYGATARGVLWQAAPGRFLLDVPDVGRFLINGGELVEIQPEPACHPNELLRHFQMAPLASLLYQQGKIPLKATALAKNHASLLVAGDAGVDKSSMISALEGEGWETIASELTMVDLDDAGVPIVIAPSSVAEEALPLQRIYWLSMHNRKHIEASEMEGTKRFRMAALLSYNSLIADVLMDHASQFRMASALAGKVGGHLLGLPRIRSCADELVEIVRKERS